MKIAVTGASGHVGNLLCRELLKAGHFVRALVHEDERSLVDLPVEKMRGDVLNLEQMKNFCSGMDVVFHLAAIISIDGDRDGRVMRVNVEGPKNIVESCLFAKVKRLIHFSSVHALSQWPQTVSLDETRPYVGPEAFKYDLSKSLGEKEVLKGIARGLDAVILNPTGVIGPYDYKPSFLGKALIDSYNGKMPILIQGGFDWVDVRDVVSSSIRAMQQGARGESYLLSGAWRTIRDLMGTLANIAQKRAPWITVPPWVAKGTVPFVKLVSKLTNKEPLYTTESIETLEKSNRHVVSKKAQQHLGHLSRPLEETVRDTLQWFKERKIIQ